MDCQCWMWPVIDGWLACPKKNLKKEKDIYIIFPSKNYKIFWQEASWMACFFHAWFKTFMWLPWFTSHLLGCCSKQGFNVLGNCLNSCFYEVQIFALLFIFSSFWRFLAQIHTLLPDFSGFFLQVRSDYIPNSSSETSNCNIFQMLFLFFWRVKYLTQLTLKRLYKLLSTNRTE